MENAADESESIEETTVSRTKSVHVKCASLVKLEKTEAKAELLQLALKAKETEGIVMRRKHALLE